jgi:GalNAc-alpha-(1->4)-GalNAc-alpha-(1->3)-diNAcBac-PP-undecaprenol alpha-1,4-N-acetyl-D-galactosaminyltransferase
VKIFFVSRLFHEVAGGIERMAVALMNELCARRYTVELLSWDSSDAKSHYPLDPRVAWHRLNMGDARERAGWPLRLRRQLAIRRLLRQNRPDVVIGFQHGPFLTVALAALGLRIPIIAAERNAPQRFDHLRVGKWRALIFQSFRLADRITVQLEEYIDRYPHYLQSRIVCIPNPVQAARQMAKPAGESGEVKRLLCVGRLSYQKNQAVLIDAFARVADAMPKWHLVFVGAGEDEQMLKRLAEEKGLQHRIEFTGAVKDVERFYASSHLFCLSSRWEGFPNALAEAMAHGLPAVGFADCAGVGQLIVDRHNGCLAPGMGSSVTLAETIGPLMADDAKRQEMGKSAVASMARFTPAAVFDRWEALFQHFSGYS